MNSSSRSPAVKLEEIQGDKEKSSLPGKIVFSGVGAAFTVTLTATLSQSSVVLPTK